MAKSDRRAFDKIKHFGTVLGAGTSFVGELKGTDSVVAHGSVSGNCNLDGSVVISQGCTWKGDIMALNVLVAGEVEGNVTAQNQLEMLATGKVVGRLACRRIAIAEGAVHQGEIRMTPEGNVTRFVDRRSAGD